MSCDVKNVIYVITCKGCNEFYIGQTGDKLRTRRTIHAQQIRDPTTRQIPLSAHLDTCSNNEPKFLMFPFYKVRTEKASFRLAKENFFIKCFKPKLNGIKWLTDLESSTTLENRTSWRQHGVMTSNNRNVDTTSNIHRNDVIVFIYWWAVRRNRFSNERIVLKW